MKSFLSCIILIFTFAFINPTVSYSQSERLLQLADKYFNEEDYYNSITEYKRFLFYNPQFDAISDVYLKIGLAYRNEHQWDEAVEMFRGIISSSNDSNSYNARLQIAITYLASNQLDAAEYELIRIVTYCNYEIIQHKANFFLGLCYMYKTQWGKAKENFDIYYSYYNNKNIKKLDSLFTEATKIRYKSPVSARWMSTFLPGLGQLYGGDYKNAANALLLNSLTGFLVVNSILDRQIEDLLIVYTPIFERFYTGNRIKAEQSILNYNSNLNDIKKHQISDELMILN